MLIIIFLIVSGANVRIILQCEEKVAEKVVSLPPKTIKYIIMASNSDFVKYVADQCARPRDMQGAARTEKEGYKIKKM
jgi:hypothetical protein